MLGEQVGEETGKISGVRVLSVEGAAPKVEVSFRASGTLLGLETTDMGTYCSILRPDGTLFGEGQGIIMTGEGDAATWRGQGAGRFTGHGTAVSWRGAIYYQSASPKLARLNGMAGIYEYEVDEHDATHAKFWEWK